MANQTNPWHQTTCHFTFESDNRINSMTATTANLWGDIEIADTTIPPVTILKEAASAITQLTNGLVEGEVRAISSSYSQDWIAYRFALRVPALNNYLAVICEVEHPAFLTPITMRDELRNIQVDSENIDGFKSVLGQCLQSREAKLLIKGLIASAKAVLD